MKVDGLHYGQLGLNEMGISAATAIVWSGLVPIVPFQAVD